METVLSLDEYVEASLSHRPLSDQERLDAVEHRTEADWEAA